MKHPYYTDQEFVSKDFSENRLAPGEYDNCQFSNCTFSNADLSATVFSACEFAHCDLSMATLQGTAFRDVKFSHCKLLGLRFDECNTFNLSFSFEGCILQFASFFNLKLPGTRFKGCNLEEVEFIGADFSNAQFEDCNLNLAVFEHTKLIGADFKTASNFAIDPEINQVQQAKFSIHNIAGLLRKYKISISL